MKLNKHAQYIVLLLFIMSLYVFPILFSGMPKTHDGELHTARFAAYYKAFEQYHIPPRWAHDLNYSYGTPLFIFYYPLPGYLGSAVHTLGISFQNSFKLLLIIAFVLAPIFFYLWMSEIFSPFVAFSSALFYGLAPYHFLDLYVRGALPELISLSLFPLVPYVIERIRKHPTIYYGILGGVFYALLILSHNIMSLIFSGIYIAYGLIRLNNKRNIHIFCLCILATGLLLTSYFWLPALVEQRFTHSTLFIGTKYKEHFPSLSQLIYSPWGFGTDVTAFDGLSPQIGPIHLILSLCCLLFSKKDKKNRWLVISGTLLFATAVYFSTKYSAFFWEIIPLLSKFEFPWRFTAISSISSAILAAIVFHNLNKNVITVIVLSILLVMSFLFTRIPLLEETKSDQYYLSFGSSTDFGAVTPMWTAGDPYEYPETNISIIDGQGSLEDIKRNPYHHSFSASAETDITILDNTLYFPGWQAYINNKKVPIQFQDPNHRGLITFNVPKGRQQVSISFHDSPIRRIGNLISLGTMGILIVVLLYDKKKWVH